MSWQTSIVRIVNKDNQTLGTGFVATAQGHILTASHVLKSNTEQSADPGLPPHAYVTFTFDAQVLQQVHEVQVLTDGWLKWGAGDVAVLKVDPQLIADIPPIPLSDERGVEKHKFETRGYPEKPGAVDTSHEDATGTIEGITHGHVNSPIVLQLRAENVSRGYSGAPVFDTERGCFVGVISYVVEADELGRAPFQAYATPFSLIFDACKALKPAEHSPYRGLAAFTESDQKYFYGRQALVVEAVSKLDNDPHVLAVIGPSGSGKSSLVRAGIIPVLRQQARKNNEEWAFISFQPGNNPYAQLGGVLPKADTLPAALTAYRKANPAVERMVIFIDQFEELFTRTDQSVADKFFKDLNAVHIGEQKTTILLTIRSEFVRRLQESGGKFSSDALDASKAHQVACNVEFSTEELREIIVKPAEQAGLLVDELLVDKLIRSVREAEEQAFGSSQTLRNRIKLPLLSLALSSVWDNWSKARESNQLQLSHLKHQDIASILTAEANKALDAVKKLEAESASPYQQTTDDIVRRIFLDLVQFSVLDETTVRTRRSRTLKELTRKPDEETRVLSIVTEFATARLLLVSDTSPESPVEIIHEILLTDWPDLDGWLRDAEPDIQVRQDLEHDAAQWHKKQAGLLGRREYRKARESLTKFDLLPEQTSKSTELSRYLLASRNRFYQQVAGAMILLVIVLALAGLVADNLKHQHDVKVKQTAIAANMENLRQQAMGEPITLPQANVVLYDHADRVPMAAFAIDRYEVSYRQYRLCVEAGACDDLSVPLPVASGLGYDHATAPADYPVQSPTAMEAARFCAWLGGRLPTVEEWEYAARGTDGRPVPWGYELPDQDTVRVNTFVGGRSWAEHPVNVDDPDFAGGSTPKGIMHMIGNVSEWTRSPASCDTGDCAPWTYGEPPPDALQLMGHSYATGTISPSVLEKAPKLLLYDQPSAPAYPVEVIGFRCVYPAANP